MGTYEQRDAAGNLCIVFDETDDTAAKRLAKIQAARERAVEAQANSKLEQPLAASFTTKIVGVSFVEDYPDNVARVERAWLTAQGMFKERRSVSGFDPDLDVDERGETFESIPAVLVRSPDNLVDPNAIEVHVPSAGDGRLGHLARVLASRLAPLLDAGDVWQAEITKVLIHSEHPDRPGIELRVWQVGTSAVVDMGDSPLT